MTRLSINEERGLFGYNYVAGVVKQGWRSLIQKFESENDRGYDAIVSDLHAGVLTSIDFKVQVKTSNFRKRYAGDTFPAPIDPLHMELYRTFLIPVVVVCVDVGPPVAAYWQVVPPGSTAEHVVMSRRRVFGPISRHSVLAALSAAFPRSLPPARGEVLRVPFNQGIRGIAKEYYRENLIGRSGESVNFGPVEFTWKGWRHITRRRRSHHKIASSLLLLPSARPVLADRVLPTHTRPLKLKAPHRGNYQHFRNILAFDRILTFSHRAATWARVVIELQEVLPIDWERREPDDPGRKKSYKFLSITELNRAVDVGVTRQ